MFGDNLEKVLACQVIARLQIHDLHLPAFTDETGDILKCDIIAGFGVVQTATGITLD